MKKAFFVLISAFLFVSCEFWNEPVEEFFSYWSAQAYVTDSTVNASKQSDSSGVTSIASDKECVVLLKTENPKDFRLIMPSSENTDMIRFNGLDVQPRLDIDYTFELLDTDTLKLTYKKDFLQAHEWGEKDLGASIILYAEDGRKFNKPYSFNIKSNTPPPPLNVVLAKTRTSSPEQYVLCLYVSPSEMGKKIGEELLHKDIAEIEINDTSYALTVNGTKNDFVKPAEESFIASGNVTKLMEANAKDLPTGSWILYYKTGLNIGSGSVPYTIKLKDEKGLTSTLETATTLNMPDDETVDIMQGSQDSESGSGTEESPFIIKPGTGTQEARIKISCATDNTIVYCTVTDTYTASTSQHSGAKSVTVLLALNNVANEKLYKVEYQTKGDGFSPTTLKTKYYKILKLHTVTFDANGGKFPADLPTAAQHVLHGRKVSAPSTQPAKDGYVFAGWYKEQEGTNKWDFVSENVTGNMTLYAKWTNNALIINSTAGAWKKLKEEAAKPSGVSVIVINGEITATSASDDSGQIEVNRNLTIQGNAGNGTDKLNAAGLSRIFIVNGSDVKLTLENLTLKNGNAAGTGEASNGGAIYTKDGTVTMQNCILTGNTTKFDNVTSTYIGYGGGVYHMGGILKIYGGEIKGNSANDGGGVYAEKANVTITGCTFTGNESSEHGGGIQVTGGTATMEHCTFTGNKSSSGGDGGGMRITGGTVEITSCTFTGNSAFSGGAIDVLGTNDISASVTISGGIIGGTGTDAKNSANSTYDDRGGGGIHVSGKADVTIQNYTDGDTEQGVMIIGNTAGTSGGQGGGVYLAENSTFKMYGGSITGNTGSGKGDGVYVASASSSDSQDANFIMGGAACVGKWDSAGILQDGNDVYLGKNTYSGHLVSIKIDKHKPITLSKAACITPQLYDDSQAVLRMSDGSAVGNYNDKFAVTPQDLGGGNTQHWEVDSDGKLMRVVDAVKYPNNAWKALKAAVNAAQPGDTITVKGEVKATNDSDNSGAITINKNLTIKKADSATSAVLDANGQAHRILKITGTAQVSLENLTLQNGKETTPSGTVGSGGGGIFMEGTAQLRLTGVTIQNCTSKAPGGGLRMDYDAAGGGTLNMENCKIINNTVKDDGGIAESSGGGIGLPNCPYTAVIDTCEISGNKVDVSKKTGSGSLITITACGLYTGNNPASITNIKGHTVIDGNSYVKHGTKTTRVRGIGIWMQGGVVNIGENGKPDNESPVIRNHQVGDANEVYGTAIYLEGSAKVNWRSGQITGNGGASKAVYVRTGYGTPVFNNESGNTAN